MSVTEPNSPAFQIESELLRLSDRVVCRATRRHDKLPVFLCWNQGNGGSEALQQELELLHEMAAEWVLQPVDMTRIDGSAALVMEDPGGFFLGSNLPNEPLPVADCLLRAIELSEAVAQVHGVGLVHRGIQPNAFHVEPFREKVKITGFNRATRLPRSTQKLVTRDLHGGTLAYLAPEQTGRVNRQVDRRADIYSIGAVLYRMLTGRPPFTGETPLDILHGVIARVAPAPVQLVPELPQILSDMVMKMLAKSADDRYHSTAGLLADLRRCQAALLASGRIESFLLAQEEAVDQLAIPDKLYGREDAVDRLTQAIERVRHGAVEMVTVTGHAGIGKTSLVLEIQGAVTAAHGSFISGKFDQLNRDQPYSALIVALDDMVGQLLTESDEAIAAWRDRLLAALGDNAQVVLDVVPDLELIIGKQSAVPSLAPVENRNRFELQFQRLISVLARRDHPLVLFLDDLQWADSASLSLIVALLIRSTSEGFLLIGAFRDNEVPPHHPLSLALKELQTSGGSVTHCVLGPLQQGHMEEMLVDSLSCDVEKVRSLAALVQGKTLGNPFFARTFLQSAFATGLLRHRRGSGWDWNTELVLRAQPTDNVVDLLAGRIDDLSQECRQILEIAACIGNRFDAALLAKALNTETGALRRALLPILREGFIDAGPGLIFAFCHDRIQEAAYRRVSEQRRNLIHLQLAELMMAEEEQKLPAEHLFEIVDHLNAAFTAIDGASFRDRFAPLNLEAGNRARASAAFDAARRYYDFGIRGLPADGWRSHYALSFSLHFGRAETAFLCGDVDDAQRDTGILLQEARERLNRGKVYGLLMVQHENSGRFAEAVAAGKSALKLFGVHFPDRSEDAEREIGSALRELDSALGSKPIITMLELPVMEQEQGRMVMHLLMTLWPSAYISGDKALTVLIAARMVALSLSQGCSPESAYGFVTHAITLGAVLHDYAAAYEYGRLALEVNRRFDDLSARAKVNHMFSCYIGFWHRPIAESFPHSREAYNSGLESGDFVYAAYGCFHESWHAMFSGMQLEGYQQDYSEKLGFLERTGNHSFHDAHSLMLQWGRCLQDPAAMHDLNSELFDEERYLDRYRQVDFFLAFHHIAKLNLLYLFGRFEEAREMARRADGVALGVRGMIWDAWLCLYRALSITALRTGESDSAEDESAELDQAVELMSVWARSSPSNFAHQFELLLAEKAAVEQRIADAISHYEAAINGAAEAGFSHNLALAKERYAEFWLSRGNARFARIYLTEAIGDYAQWGAKAKVQQLVRRHSEILGETAHGWLGGSHPPERDPIDSATIVSATLALSSELDAERVADVLLRLLMQASGAERALLFRMEHNRPILVREGRLGGSGVSIEAGDSTDDWRGRALEKAINYVVHTRRSLLTGDAVQDERMLADQFLAGSSVRSLICVPMVNQSELEGVVYLENRQLGDAFTPRHLDIAEMLAIQAAVSLKNVRLFDGLQVEVERRRKAESRLREVAEGTAAAVGERFFQKLVLHLSHAMRVRIAFVTECDPDDNERVRAIAFVDNGEFVDGVEYDLEGTPCREVIDGALCFYPSQLAQRYPKEVGLESYLGTPMRDSSGIVIGHLAVVHDQPLQESPEDSRLLQIFAIRAGAELELQKAQGEAERSRRMLAERERLASIGEFASMIAHEIRTPLSTMQMALDYLNGQSLAQGAQKRIALAASESQRLQALLSEMLLFAKPQVLNPVRVDLLLLAEEVLDTLRQAGILSEQQVAVSCRSSAKVVDGDRDKLTQVLINLLSNARQAIDESETIDLILRDADAADSLCLEIRNSGVIDRQLLPRLTEPFFTTKARGTGLGLSIVRRIVEAHQGALEIVCNEPEQQVCVLVTLPAAGG